MSSRRINSIVAAEFRLRRVPGIDREHGAGDVAAALTEQIFHHARDIVGLRKATQRAAAGDALASFVGEIVGQLGVDETRRDRVHGDAELADLARERAGEAGGGGLGRAVDGEAVVARGRDDRGDVETN